MSQREPFQTLSEACAEAERTDPAVKAAADKYDFVVWRLNRQAERRRRREARESA